MADLRKTMIWDEPQLRIRWVYEWRHPHHWSLARVVLPYSAFWYVLGGSKEIILEDRWNLVRPMEYVPHAHIRRSRKLLAATSQPLQHIAAEIGSEEEAMSPIQTIS